jgi:hypothetical protein
MAKSSLSTGLSASTLLSSVDAKDLAYQRFCISVLCSADYESFINKAQYISYLHTGMLLDTGL